MMMMMFITIFAGDYSSKGLFVFFFFFFVFCCCSHHSSFSRQLDFNWDATVSVEQGSKVLNVSAIAREVARLGRGRHAESCALAPNSARA